MNNTNQHLRSCIPKCTLFSNMFHNFLMQTRARSLCRKCQHVRSTISYQTCAISFLIKGAFVCMCANLHLESSHNDHSLDLSIRRGDTTSILQLIAKKKKRNKMHQSVFYTGKRNHNHNLFKLHRMWKSQTLTAIYRVSSLRIAPPLPWPRHASVPHCPPPPPPYRVDDHSSPPLELARNTCFTSTQPLYSSFVGVNCKILVNRFSECVRRNACEEFFGLVTHRLYSWA